MSDCVHHNFYFHSNCFKIYTYFSKLNTNEICLYFLLSVCVCFDCAWFFNGALNCFMALNKSSDIKNKKKTRKLLWMENHWNTNFNNRHQNWIHHFKWTTIRLFFLNIHKYVDSPMMFIFLPIRINFPKYNNESKNKK